jgi:hypothetical protein
MANKWLTHVKATMKRMKKSGTYKKGDGLKKVIMEAKKDYKKVRGGAEEEKEPMAKEGDAMAEPAPAALPEGGRRRRTRRRRHRR